jgi:4-amino-4-deoxy-L-arabinose transferase-like glycosyltransferase
VAWLCALVACLNAVAWSVITPPFQVPDEPEHIAYVKQLAETGRLPSGTGNFSLEELLALDDTRLQLVAENPVFQPISSKRQESQLQSDLRTSRQSPEKGSEYAGVAAAQPPLYYAFEAIPYKLGASGTLLERLELMRLLSALMAGLTALFSFLFLRETLPRLPWAWTVGGFAVALVPLLGFMSGAVNPDSMLYAVTAALFFALARGFHVGLTRANAIAIGALIAVGFSTKLNFVGIAPGALAGLILLSVRSARSAGRAAYLSLALALSLALSPPLAYVLLHTAKGAPTLGIVSRAFNVSHGSPWQEFSYLWQLYLPKLPGMPNDFSGILPPRDLWFKGYVGLYGWLDTTFPGWVYQCALVIAVAIVGLCVRGAVLSAAALRARIAELLVYCLIVLGLLALVGADSYLAFPRVNAEYAQTRYLLPFLPLLGGVLALAARGGGRRWGPAVGAAIVLLFLGHDIFSQLQAVARFYG